MNTAARDYGSGERYLPLLREEMTEELFLYLRKLQHGPPDLTEALALAGKSDGLVGDPQDCAMKIIDAVQCACLAWEAHWRGARDRAAARERLEERQVAVANMHLLARQLEADTRVIAANRSGIFRSAEHREALIDVIRAVTDAADAVELFIEGQRLLLRDNGGNRKAFDHLFVRKMRTVWQDMTGKNPGVATTRLVKFSELVWVAFGFQPRRPRPLFPWLSERFSKIR